MCAENWERAPQFHFKQSTHQTMPQSCSFFVVDFFCNMIITFLLGIVCCWVCKSCHTVGFRQVTQYVCGCCVVLCIYWEVLLTGCSEGTIALWHKLFDFISKPEETKVQFHFYNLNNLHAHIILFVFDWHT